jgi:hypothetical protein
MAIKVTGTGKEFVEMTARPLETHKQEVDSGPAVMEFSLIDIQKGTVLNELAHSIILQNPRKDSTGDLIPATAPRSDSPASETAKKKKCWTTCNEGCWKCLSYIFACCCPDAI